MGGWAGSEKIGEGEVFDQNLLNENVFNKKINQNEWHFLPYERKEYFGTVQGTIC